MKLCKPKGKEKSAVPVTARMSRVLEINADSSKISLPLVKFPPFKLRALLIEKDPVVWAHLLDTYVAYFEYLVQGSRLERIDDTTLDNLRIFIRSYLHEMALEEGTLLSLGENQDVAKNLQYLRAWIFTLIKKSGLLFLQIYGESLWDLIKVYVCKNPISTRKLIDGSLEPELNVQKAQISKIYQVQQHLKYLVENNAFSRLDLKTFEMLLSGPNAETFADLFLTSSWMETLESWWAKGRGKMSSIARKLSLITLLSCNTQAIVKVTNQLGINDAYSLSMYPLLGCILTNSKFLCRKPMLLQLFPYLQAFSISSEKVESPIQIKAEDVATLQEIFPHLSQRQLSELLKKYDNNVEVVTNHLFEDPSIADSILPEEEQLVEDDLQANDRLTKPGQKKLNTSNNEHDVPDAIRNKTLKTALALLYQDDEDERDDTYDDAEVARSKNITKIGPKDENDEQLEPATNGEYDQIEAYLWDLLKQDASLFARTKRGSKIRKDMKSDTKWSDEQIEGWARMLERSPQRARILEQKFMFRGNRKTGKTSYVHNRDSLKLSETHEKEQPRTSKQKKPTNTKKQYARNEQHKSSRANHNRKSAHDKKLSRASGPP